MKQINSPELGPSKQFTDASAAVDELERLYEAGTEFLRTSFSDVVEGERPDHRFRAFYPEIRLSTTSFAHIDNRLSFGHVVEPGEYSTTVTRPDLFRNYLIQQISLIIDSHSTNVTIGVSATPIPLHFAMKANTETPVPQEGVLDFPLRDMFDVPDLATTHDDIVNGVEFRFEDGSRPLAPFTAQRIDYSLARLQHYTATAAEHFQNHILFTNYQFYVDEFASFARRMLADPDSGYDSFVATGNVVITDPKAEILAPGKMPQMPSYHLTRPGGGGISLVNIGVGPSNAKTATDHIAVLRPHAWLMLGHCAGLRNTQALGDYVLAHAYLREDHVLDADLPVWVPIPALAEVQIALEQAVANVTKLQGYELKKIMRTGTVATIDHCTLVSRGLDNFGGHRLWAGAKVEMSNCVITGTPFVFATAGEGPETCRIRGSLILAEKDFLSVEVPPTPPATQYTKKPVEPRLAEREHNINLPGCILEDPQFVDPINSDFRLRDTSPGWQADRGSNLGANLDADGWPIPSKK